MKMTQEQNDLISKMRALLAAQPLAAVVQMFEQTETMTGAEIPTVRGVLMEEMEARNPEAFDKWIECTDPALIVTPSHFFI